jgi:hypothetical protein
VKSWSDKLGFELLQLGKFVTKIDKFHENFHKEGEIKINDGKIVVEKIAKNIEGMMNSKIDAIQVGHLLLIIPLPYKAA